MVQSSQHRPASSTFLFVLGTLAAVASIAMADEPETIQLSGVVRDFAEVTAPNGHPDFEVTPDHGFDHYAGNVAPLLDEDGKPSFVGGGYEVREQWTDAQGRPIAPLLYNSTYGTAGGGGDEALSPPVVLQDSRGREAYEITRVSIVFNDNGTSSWTYRVRELPGGRDLSHWNLRLDPAHTVVAGTTPGYDYGVDGSTGFFGIKWDVNDSFSDAYFTVVLDGHFQGQVMADGVLAKGGNRPDTGAMYVPTTTPGSGDGQAVLIYDESIGDHEGESGYTDDGGIDSVDSFRQWFRDTPGVNLSAPLTLTFNRQEDGTYVFDDKVDPCYQTLGGFFPIDGEMLGNSGGSPDHNYHFTFELHTTFTYDASASQVFEFAGDDDVWVFIDGRLAIDLGGIHSSTTQFVSLDRLGLEDGETYSLDFFFAERHRTQSNFRITTNLELSSARSLPSITAAFD